MARNGSGAYSLPAGNPVVTGTTISSVVQNNTMTDIGTALTQSLAYDGQTNPVANLPMAGFKHTGVANASARTDYAAAGQVQDSSLIWAGTAGGTANALTLTLSPAITAIAAGQRFAFKSGASPNSAATTVAISGLTAIAAQVNGAACAGGEILANSWYEILANTTTTCQLNKIGRATPAELGAVAKAGDTMTGALNEAHGADIASASTINLTTATGNLVDVTGTTTITAITLADGAERTVRFTGILTLTNGASLVLPGAANITTAVGDFAVFRGYAAGVVRCVAYTRADGSTIGGLKFGGAPSVNVNTTWTAATAAGKMINLFGASTTQTLPLGSTLTSGTAIGYFNLSSSAHTITRQGSEPMQWILGTASFVLNQYDSVLLVWDGNNWEINFFNGATGLARPTWQDMTASRAMTTAYTNSTGRQIQVQVAVEMPLNSIALLNVDGTFVHRMFAQSNTTAYTVSAPVENGSTYSVTSSGGVVTITPNGWKEKR